MIGEYKKDKKDASTKIRICIVRLSGAAARTGILCKNRELL